MKTLIRKISFLFSSGAVGGLSNGLVVWLFGIVGIATFMGVQISPQLSPQYLYFRIVWGGIWGIVLLIPIFNNRLPMRAFILSLFPSIVQLLIVFPLKDQKGLLGVTLGNLTPLFVIFYNYIWALAAVYWYESCKGK